MMKHYQLVMKRKKKIFETAETLNYKSEPEKQKAKKKFGLSNGSAIQKELDDIFIYQFVWC